MIISLIFLSVLIFFLIHMLPGDPISVLLGRDARPELIEITKEFYGLDLPVYQQYFKWVSNIFHGDFGHSLRDGSSVISLLAERIPRTLILCLGSVIFGIIISIPAGIYSAKKQGTWGDFFVTSYSVLLLSIPQFWLGLFLIVVISLKLKLLPSSGWIYPSEDFIGFLKIIILPIITSASVTVAITTRMLRSSMIGVLSSEYISLARAKGNSERRILMVHSFRNSLIPVLTVVSFQFGYLLGGSIVIEKVFNYPGMGALIISAMTFRDYPVVQVAILFYSMLFMAVNLSVDIAYVIIDPTIRY